MTAKHAVYLAILQGTVNLDELQSQHRSLQVRRIGRSDYQIRFKDSETWQRPKDWAQNYRSSLVKQLADLVTADLQVLSPAELFSALPRDRFKSMILEEIDALMQKQPMVDLEEYNELQEVADAYKSALDDEKIRACDLQSKVDSLEIKLNDSYSRAADYRNRVAEELGKLQNESKLGMVSTKALNEAKERLGL